jgi:hypothetical protein
MYKHVCTLQELIARSHGSQCGFCTPGIVMSMYTLLRNSPRPTQMEMERAFEGKSGECCTLDVDNTNIRLQALGETVFCMRVVRSYIRVCGFTRSSCSDANIYVRNVLSVTNVSFNFIYKTNFVITRCEDEYIRSNYYSCS